MKKYKTGVYILRAEPDHLAHHDTIKIMREQCEQCIISVGSYNRPRTFKNPFTSKERIRMLINSHDEIYGVVKSLQLNSPLLFQEVRDYMYNDYKWAAEVYSKAIKLGATQDKTTCLFGHFKDDSSYYLNMFPQWDLTSVESLRGGLSSTWIREELFETGKITKYRKDISENTAIQLESFLSTDEGQKIKEEYDFIKKYKEIWSNAPFPPTFVTADSVVVKSGHILLIKRGNNPGKGLYALPGGFIGAREKIQDSALRELREETRISVPKASLEKQICDYKMFDHPYRSLRGRTITHVYTIDLGIGALPDIKAGDDASGAQWIPLADAYAMENQMFEDHYDILVNMTSKF